MGALAVLPSNKCGAHETFHDWSIPPYTATYVVPSVSRAFLERFCGRFSSVSEGKIGRKSVENVQRNARETASTMTKKPSHARSAFHHDVLSSLRKIAKSHLEAPQLLVVHIFRLIPNQ